MSKSEQKRMDALGWVAKSTHDEALDRIRELEAENYRLNMEMAAYRQGCTPKDAEAMLAVKDALDAEKARRNAAKFSSNFECPVCRRPLDDDQVLGSCANTKDGHHRRVQCSPSSGTTQDRGGEHG